MSNQTVSATPADDKLDFKRILPIITVVMVDLLGLTIIIPLLPLYAASFGANALMVGVITTAYPLMQFLGAPLLGGLSDRFGRKPVLIISQIGTFIGFIILGLANSIPILILARIIDGISGANISAAQAALTDSTTEKTRTQGLGLLGAAFGLGFIIGPIIAFVSLALSNNDYRIPAFVAAGFSLLSIILTTVVFKETLPPEKRSNQAHIGHEKGITRGVLGALSQPRTGVLLALIFAQQLVFFGFESLITLFTLNRLGMNASSNTMLFVYVGVIIVTVQGYFIGRWSRRYGERRLILGGLTLLSLGLVLTAFTPGQPVPWYSQSEIAAEMTRTAASPTGGEGAMHSAEAIAIDLPSDENTGWLGIIWLMAAMIPTSIGGGLLSPSINSMLTKSVSASEVGSTLGVSASLVSGANAISPVVGGSIFQAFGSTAPFLGGGIVLAALALFATRRIQPISDSESSPTPQAAR